MALLEEGRLVEDKWQHLDEGEEAQAGAAVLLSYARFAEEREQWRNWEGTLGVILPNDLDPSILSPDLQKLSLVVLDFPAFKDGRAYSQARILRERYSYRGKLRARGDVLIDQYFFMRRCGFDSFEVPDDIDVKAWEQMGGLHDIWYQPSGGLAGETIFQKRHKFSASS